MRIRCRLGIHDWSQWELLPFLSRASSIYYSQQTRCQCCGLYRLRTAAHHKDFKS